jgi:hypothetical protein
MGVQNGDCFAPTFDRGLAMTDFLFFNKPCDTPLRMRRQVA